ncbi:MAG: hypothetical protein RSD49_17200 [Hafnia sp.]
MPQRILALGIEQAKTDADKAMLLSSIIRFARAIGDDTLVEAANGLMPQAHPFKPPLAWKAAYCGAFENEADESTGTYVDDMDRYCADYWCGLTDAQRQERLQRPALGESDGAKDAATLNAVNLNE